MPKRFVLSELSSHPIVMDVPDHELRQLLFDTLAGPSKGTWSSALHHARENLERQFSDAMVRAGYELDGPDAWVLKHVTWPWA